MAVNKSPRGAGRFAREHPIEGDGGCDGLQSRPAPGRCLLRARRQRPRRRSAEQRYEIASPHVAGPNTTFGPFASAGGSHCAAWNRLGFWQASRV